MPPKAFQNGVSRYVIRYFNIIVFPNISFLLRTISIYTCSSCFQRDSLFKRYRATFHIIKNFPCSVSGISGCSFSSSGMSAFMAAHACFIETLKIFEIIAVPELDTIYRDTEAYRRRGSNKSRSSLFGRFKITHFLSFAISYTVSDPYKIQYIDNTIPIEIGFGRIKSICYQHEIQDIHDAIGVYVCARRDRL